MCNPYVQTDNEIIDIKKETDIDSTYRVRSDFKPNFGQFFQVSLPTFGDAPISVSDFGDNWLDLTIRKVGRLTDEIHKKKVGDRLFLRGPYGRGFIKEEFYKKHLVIVAGGTGAAPVRSLINYYIKNSDELLKLDILLGFKNPDNILFNKEIENWRKKFPLILTVDEAYGVWDGERVGLVTEYVKEIKMTDFKEMEIIIVGPTMMMKYTAEEFVKRGVHPERILVSYERNMSCGIGKCGHCKINDKYVCLDGPVIRYNQTLNLKD